MAVSAISPISSFAAINGVSGIGAVGTFDLGAGANKASKATGATSIDFGDALAKVQSSIDDADQLSRQLATGELTDISQYTVAASKAQLGVQLTVALRNQLLSAFQEVMRMQL
ncbi:MAG: flagellar hook-basal body complex protein FliE [Acidimicrobiales bacterium]|nr:flagellar hook-basal body complex protein FliE [Acidimicrobiales bacterium]